MRSGWVRLVVSGIVNILRVLNTYCIPCPEWSTWKLLSVWLAAERQSTEKADDQISPPVISYHTCSHNTDRLGLSSGSSLLRGLRYDSCYEQVLPRAEDYNLTNVVHVCYLLMLLGATLLRLAPSTDYAALSALLYDISVCFCVAQT